MKALEYRHRDKKDWGDGPWQQEPDKMQWRDEATGLPCLIVRNHSGALCGYVGVPEGHPWFEKEYNEVHADVHGGLTFSHFCSPGHEHGICHVVEEGEDDRAWWLGFDCAHLGDFCPASTALGHPLWDDGDYKTVQYVKMEIVKLALQAKDAV